MKRTVLAVSMLMLNAAAMAVSIPSGILKDRNCYSQDAWGMTHYAIFMVPPLYTLGQWAGEISWNAPADDPNFKMLNISVKDEGSEFNQHAKASLRAVQVGDDGTDGAALRFGTDVGGTCPWGYAPTWDFIGWDLAKKYDSAEYTHTVPDAYIQHGCFRIAPTQLRGDRITVTLTYQCAWRGNGADIRTINKEFNMTRMPANWPRDK